MPPKALPHRITLAQFEHRYRARIDTPGPRRRATCNGSAVSPADERPTDEPGGCGER